MTSTNNKLVTGRLKKIPVQSQMTTMTPSTRMATSRAWMTRSQAPRKVKGLGILPSARENVQLQK